MAIYKQITATNQIKVGLTKLKSIIVSSVSGSPTITVYDEDQNGTTRKAIDTFIPVGATVYMFTGDEGGLVLNKGCNVVLGGTVSCTVCFE